MHRLQNINDIKKAFSKLEPELAELEKNKAFVLFLIKERSLAAVICLFQRET